MTAKEIEKLLKELIWLIVGPLDLKPNRILLILPPEPLHKRDFRKKYLLLSVF